MKHIFHKTSLLVLILLTTFSDCVSQHNLWEDPHWKLAWEDHFNGNSLDNTKWLAANYAVHGKEPQIYMSSQVKIENGNLVIKAVKEDVYCPSNPIGIVSGG